MISSKKKKNTTETSHNLCQKRLYTYKLPHKSIPKLKLPNKAPNCLLKRKVENLFFSNLTFPVFKKLGKAHKLEQPNITNYNIT